MVAIREGDHWISVYRKVAVCRTNIRNCVRQHLRVVPDGEDSTSCKNLKIMIEHNRPEEYVQLLTVHSPLTGHLHVQIFQSIGQNFAGAKRGKKGREMKSFSMHRRCLRQSVPA
jgi:ribosomal protein S14